MKIKKTSLPDEIVERIKAAIKNDEWKPGTKLPSENELSELFGVNRLTVRSALQKLNTLGIVETRIGDGTYVKDFSFSNFLSEVSDFYLKPEMLDNVCEFRKLFEVECARLAMERATPSDLAGLEAICDRYDEVSGRLFSRPELDPEMIRELIDADLEFHQEIVKLSKNTLYEYAFMVARESILRYLGNIITQRIHDTEDKRSILQKACSEHRNIYHSILDKDFETCRKLYFDMVDYHVKLE